MQYSDQTKMLFQLTTELTDKKVEIAVIEAISQVVNQIIELRAEMHREISSLRLEMIERFSKVESRLAAVETALGQRNQSRHEIRIRFYEYAFKAGWLLLGSGLMYLMVHFHAA